MNLPNLITVSRIPILFIITGLLWPSLSKETTVYVPSVQWGVTIAFVLFLFASISDWLDGFLARKMNIESDYGAFMDALCDKVLVTGMFIVLLAFKIMPFWTLPAILLILCREFIITGLRLVAAGQGLVLAAEKAGKLKTVLQLIAINALIFVEGLRHEYEIPLNIVDLLELVALAIFIVATLLTIISGAMYLKKYWKIISPGNS